MSWSVLFFFNSIFFGVGLAMDAFSVSLVNGLRQTRMPRRAMLLTAGVFAVFQTAMPMLGWMLVHTVAETFQAVQRFIPWIALLLLAWIGGSMIRDGLRRKDAVEDAPAGELRDLLIQGIATSIDALSVGFTISEYTWLFALVEALIIGVVTFLICLLGLRLGKRFGTILAGKATVTGGLILMVIGVEIFLKSLAG